MAAKYFAILTNLGAAKLANATALGTQLEITHMAVGDGGGGLPIPNPAQTALIGERRRAAINLLTIDPLNNSQIISEQVIPEDVGGWWIREVGLFDKDGALVAIANCPETYKPQLQEGSGRTQTIRVILIVSSTQSVSLKIDPSVVLATRQYVDDKVIEVRAYADKLMELHAEADDPHKQYAKVSNAPETLNDLGKVAAAINNDPKFSESIGKSLNECKHGRLLNVRLFSVSGVYRPTSGTKTIVVELIGGGGGGGGASTTPPGQVSIGGGGAAACYIKFKISNITDELSVNVTIGSGGAPGGGSINQRGGNGGNSLFGEYATAPGGPGGICFTGTPPVFAQNSANNELIPTLSPLALAIYAATGGPGFGGFIVSSTGLAMSGNGGFSHFGHGGNNVGTNTPGLDAKSYGAGGSGSCNNGLNANLPTLGGRGAGGFCVVWEYS